MMKARASELKKQLQSGLLICDGAMGTTLSAAGHAGAALELMNVEQPELVRTAHQAYLDAGADIIETNTFGGNRPNLDRHSIGDRTVELNKAGARIAREAAGNSAFVAGSIGPTGKVLEPYGDFDPALAKAAFEEQAQALAEGGVDLFIVETFAAVEEVELAIAAVKKTGLLVAASMSFQYVAPPTTPWGVTSEQAAKRMTAVGSDVVGANCGTISSEEMIVVLTQFREFTTLPLIAQPNAGRPQLTESGTIFPEAPNTFAEVAPRFRDLGATIIGGCCGTTAAHIRAIVERLRTN